MRVRLSSGRVEEEVDLIVGADGMFSAIRGGLLGRSGPERRGYVVYRGVAKKEEKEEEEEEKGFSFQVSIHLPLHSSNQCRKRSRT